MSNPRDSRTHIKVLVDFLESCPEMPNALELRNLCDPTKVVRSISYASLWLVFTPETLVVAQNLQFSEWQVFLVDGAIPPTKSMDRKGGYVYSDQGLVLRNIEYSGTYFKFQPSERLLKRFSGVSPLAELNIVPLSLVHGYERKRDLLVARGRKFWDLRDLHMKEYVDRSSSNSSFAVGSLFLSGASTFLGQFFIFHTTDLVSLLNFDLQENERVMVDWAKHNRCYYERAPPRDKDSNDSTRAVKDASESEWAEADLEVAVKSFTVHIV